MFGSGTTELPVRLLVSVLGAVEGEGSPPLFVSVRFHNRAKWVGWCFLIDCGRHGDSFW